MGVALDQLESDAISPGGGRSIKGQTLRRGMYIATTAWLFGSVWSTAISGATFTRFINVMGPSNRQWGLLTAIPFLTSLLSIPAALISERTGQRKRIFLWSLFLNRWMWFFLAFIPLILMHRYGAAASAVALAGFMPMYFFMHAGNAIGSPSWTSWMSDLVPARIRGVYFSKRRQVGLIPAIPAALLAGWALDHFAQGSGFAGQLNEMWICALIFTVAGVLGMVDITLFIFVPDSPQEPRQGAALYRAFLTPLRDRQFLWWAAFVGMLSFAVAPMGMWITLYLIKEVGISNRAVQGMLLVAPMLAQWLVLPIVGRCADRMGKKPLLTIAALGLVPVGAGWCFVGPTMPWLGYVLAAAGAALWVGVEVANFNIVLEMAEGKNAGASGSSYVAVNTVIINVAACAGCLLWGQSAQALGTRTFSFGGRSFNYFHVLFLASAALRLVAAVVFLPGIREPAARSTRETLQFVTTNLYNNLFNGIWLSMKWIKFAGNGRDKRRDEQPTRR